jgi:hypothetical protein
MHSGNLNFKTMKRLIIILLVVVSINQANAQFFQVGAKAGISSSHLKVDAMFSGGDDQESVFYKSGEAVLGWHLGLYSRIQVSRFYIQPELLYSSTGGKIKISNDGIDFPGINEIKLNKLDIPILAGWTFGKSFRVYAGPSFSYLLSEKSVWKNTKEVFKQDFTKGTIGYQAGIGVDITTISLDLKYEGNLSALGKSVSIPGTDVSFDTDIRNPQLILSMGFRF